MNTLKQYFMCSKRSLKGGNETGRDRFYRHVRQDFSEDVINGRQRGVCQVGGVEEAGGLWERVGQDIPGRGEIA